MPVVKAVRRIPVPARVAYEVAADVGAYQEFLPLLEESAILGEVAETSDSRRFQARLVVGYKKLGLRERFTSDVLCDWAKRSVTATSREAPFRQLRTVWTVRDSGAHVEVAVEVDYAMRNPLLQLALSGAMDVVVGKVMAAFEARALQVHARASSSN
jgi:coenzyme Q-binding protein COQ10